jgi:predicted HicB family RNase H-like nuclease
MDLLKYKDYEGTAELDMTRRVCRGRILFIDDVVTYEAASPELLQQEFEAAVDDYLQTCVRVGKEPQRPFKGLFNVRVPAPLHRSAALRATRDGISLNEVVVSALTSYLQAPPVVGDGKTADAARR